MTRNTAMGICFLASLWFLAFGPWQVGLVFGIAFLGVGLLGPSERERDARRRRGWRLR